MTSFVRGEIVLANLDPVLGTEQSKRRPCVVLSATVYNSRSVHLVIVPITSKIKGYPFEVSISAGDVKGVALVDHIRAIDPKVRKVVSAGVAVSFSELHQIQGLLDALLFR